ncbi:MAG: hypothetical protein Q8P32_00080 [Candidatus Komeilibacteria bacterium]|nr:hypothetical protein [Candidatus Komeilibacteria bacterium]
MSKIALRQVTVASPNELKKAYVRSKKILLHDKPLLSVGDLSHVVKHLLTKRRKILQLAKKHATPFYILDEQELTASLKKFTAAFAKHLPSAEHYYAVKLNHHPEVVKRVLRHGFKLDVSSAKELELGLSLGATKFVFSGPAKTVADLSLAIKNRSKVTVNLDSFSELQRLGKLTNKHKKSIRAGVRIFTKYHGAWNKFGIDLKDLALFFKQAKKYPLVNLTGIQFHISWNESALPYQRVIAELAGYLKKHFSQSDLSKLEFIDLGGGFRPFQSEGYYPWRLPQGRIIKETCEFNNQEPKFSQKYYVAHAVTIDEYASGIASAIKKYLQPLVNCVYYTEPGRYLANNSLHILTSLIDVKGPQYGVVDAGINAIGWERFYYEYFPLINLTHPSLQEKDFIVYGSLCMADDLWGYYCHAQKMQEGDLILVPYQGALTYSLAQEFIKPIPPVYLLK